MIKFLVRDKVLLLPTTNSGLRSALLTVSWTHTHTDAHTRTNSRRHTQGFSEQRVRNGLDVLKKARRTKPQGKLDSFFKMRAPSPTNTLLTSQKPAQPTSPEVITNSTTQTTPKTSQPTTASTNTGSISTGNTLADDPETPNSAVKKRELAANRRQEGELKTRKTE